MSNRIIKYSKPNHEKINEFLSDSIKALEDKDYAFINDMYKKIKTNKFNINDIVIYYNSLVSYINQRFLDVKKFEMQYFIDYQDIIFEYESLEEFILFIGSKIKNCFESIDKLKDKSNKYEYSFNDILYYVNNNYKKNITLDELSKEFFINSKYICYLFKKNTQKTFLEYLMNLRMDKACKLLKNTNMHIYKIAEEVGYEYYYFITLFKKVKGITPLRYRNVNLTHKIDI